MIIWRSKWLGGLIAVGLAGILWWFVSYTAQSDRNAQLAAAVAVMDVQKVASLLGQGADPNGMSLASNETEGHRAPVPLLLDAVERAGVGPPMAEALLDRGAHIDVKDSNGRTALMAAAALTTPQALKLLLAHRAALEARDNFGWTALRYAVWKRQMAAVEILLSAGADVNTQDKQGKSPLMAAVDAPEIVAQLLNKGARVDTKDVNGWTAMTYATKNADTETLRLLNKKTR